MDVRLRSNYDLLLDLYHANLNDVHELQETLINDILPSLTDELGLTPDATEWAKEWVSDTATMFRIAKLNKFTKSFTLESIRKNLIWRLQNLWQSTSPPVPTPGHHCLPPEVVDPLGRPIIIIETVPVTLELDVVKQGLIQFFENLRRHLAERFHSCEQKDAPPLQCMVLVDLRLLSFQRSALDIMNWTMREVIPRYPGMLAGVCMLNYSWAHASVWTVVKRILPESALSKVFFPSQKELLDCFSPSCIPKDYGGDLPPLAELPDPLLALLAQEDSVMEPPPPPEEPMPQATMVEEKPRPLQPPSLPWISRTSVLNPFFGYPVSNVSDRTRLPSLRHGRRRKRDLVKTLALLFWSRWHSYIVFGCCFSVVCAVMRWRLRSSLTAGIIHVLKDVRTAMGR